MSLHIIFLSLLPLTHKVACTWKKAQWATGSSKLEGRDLDTFCVRIIHWMRITVVRGTRKHTVAATHSWKKGRRLNKCTIQRMTDHIITIGDSWLCIVYPTWWYKLQISHHKVTQPDFFSGFCLLEDPEKKINKMQAKHHHQNKGNYNSARAALLGLPILQGTENYATRT